MVFEFGEFELDEGCFELRRRGQVVPCQPKVLRLLLCLVKYRDRVVETHELLEALWPRQVVGSTSLPKAVRLARRSLGDSSESQAVVRTVRARGYRFVAPVRERGASLDVIQRRIDSLTSELTALREQVGSAPEHVPRREPTRLA
jgi:DNA-binding winged helix-turn-helix (wHTH) protein